MLIIKSIALTIVGFIFLLLAMAFLPLSLPFFFMIRKPRPKDVSWTLFPLLSMGTYIALPVLIELGVLQVFGKISATHSLVMVISTSIFGFLAVGGVFVLDPSLKGSVLERIREVTRNLFGLISWYVSRFEFFIRLASYHIVGAFDADIAINGRKGDEGDRNMRILIGVALLMLTASLGCISWYFVSLFDINAALLIRIAILITLFQCSNAGLIVAYIGIRFWRQTGPWGNNANLVSLGRLSSSKIGGQQNPSAVNTVTIAHLSDLHIPKNDETELTEGRQWIAQWLKSLQKKLAKLRRNKKLVVVVSGDVTDTGDSAAWQEFRRNFSHFKNNIVIAPGNHDLNVVGYGVPSLLFDADKSDWSGRGERIKNYFESAVKLMGKRTHVIIENDDISKLECAWQNISKTTTPGEMFDAATKLFPLWVTCPLSPGVVYVVWNTTRTSRFAFFNSVGEIDKSQLDRYKIMLKSGKYKNAARVHIMHHKLGYPENGLISPSKGIFTNIRSFLQRLGMVMINADEVVDAISKKDISSVVLHGHHHASFEGQIGALQVFSAPSSTLGAELTHGKSKKPGTFPGFFSFDLYYSRRSISFTSNSSRRWN